MNLNMLKYDMEKYIFRYAYSNAFHDATLRKAFRRKTDEEDVAFAKRKQEIFVSAYPVVKDYMVKIIENSHPKPIDSIRNICNDESGFTFGNAQKLVNMTSKYFYTVVCKDINKREWFSECDCPMDGKMMELLLKQRTDFKYSNLSWSKLEIIDGKIPDEYSDFQNSIRILCDEQGIYPIEYDYIYWTGTYRFPDEETIDAV